MKCDACGAEFAEGDPVRLTWEGEIHAGRFEPVEEQRVVHDECPEFQ